MRIVRNSALLVCLLTLTGCQYYRITDSASGKSYITNNWNMNQNYYTGSAAFTEPGSGKLIVTQSYEAEKIGEPEAKALMGSSR